MAPPASSSSAKKIARNDEKLKKRNNLILVAFLCVCAISIGHNAFSTSAMLSKQSVTPLEDILADEENAYHNVGNSDSINNDNRDQQKDAEKRQARSRTETHQQQEQQQEQQQREGQSANVDKPLNIVLLYADDWSYTSLGALGNTYIQTPRLDEMARNGTLFTHSCVTTSICMVSRASLYTGQYLARHRTRESYNNITMFDGDNWSHTLFPQLKKAGYYTGLFGKWHHNGPPQTVPTFDEFISYQSSHYKKRNRVLKHITEWNEIDGMEFLRNRPNDQPFALTISFFATHAEDGSPEQYRPMNSSMWIYANTGVPRPKTFTQEHLDALPKFLSSRQTFPRGRALKRYYPEEKFQLMMKNMYRMASEVDAVCGRVIDELERQGVLNETLVIFTTDNGNFHGQHGLAEKWYAYEESLRVPLIVLDPRLSKAERGGKVSEFALNIDLAPTILSAAQIKVPEVMQGSDLAQLYLNPGPTKQSWRQEFFYEWVAGPVHFPTNYALVRKDKKFIQWPQHDLEQLFDLQVDPFEEVDLNKDGDTYNDTVNEMRSRMFELQALAAKGVKM